MIELAETREALSKCFPVIRQLRTELDKDQFVDSVETMWREGYQLAYLQEEGDVVACAGYRIQNTLAIGKSLYVDDLVTSADTRSRGNGQEILKWLVEQAELQGCASIHLDSGVQRHDAHKFYLNNDFKIVCYHFYRELGNC